MKVPKILLDGHTRRFYIADNPNDIARIIIVRDKVESEKDQKKIRKFLVKFDKRII